MEIPFSPGGETALPLWRFSFPLVDQARVGLDAGGGSKLVVTSRSGVAASEPQVVEHNVAFGG